uniref:Uncharacterized protein n=1 Tax=Vespula pensylvanica TaxID=30213 RepID=A0A834P7P8_VESPE|nr:hypothetical protein H0235_006469 [Vespula pensylvanica]
MIGLALEASGSFSYHAPTLRHDFYHDGVSYPQESRPPESVSGCPPFDDRGDSSLKRDERRRATGAVVADFARRFHRSSDAKEIRSGTVYHEVDVLVVTVKLIAGGQREDERPRVDKRSRDKKRIEDKKIRETSPRPRGRAKKRKS